MSKIMELADKYACETHPRITAARAALQAEVEKLEAAYMNGYECAKQEARDAYDALRAESNEMTLIGVRSVADVLALRKKLALVEKDAERYQWLREQNADLDAGFYVGDETDALPEDITWVGSDLDSAIDTAMGATK